MTVQETTPAIAAGRASAGERNYHSSATCHEPAPWLKLARIGMRSPRLYYLDDVAGPTGKIVVGYIGPHMTNTQTS